jgi:hypothetical protein
VTATIRPSFFIIGERKCGTSSLYRYLLEHPQVLPGQRKEMQFFTEGSAYVEANIDSYLARFPSVSATASERLHWPELDKEGKLFEEEIEFPRQEGVHYRTGEASADTFAEVDPALLRRYLPEAKLIVLLRDPAERAFSHHRMLRRFQEEGRDLPERIGDFAEDMRAEMSASTSERPAPLLSLGIYTEKLRAWEKEWGNTALLVLFSDYLQDEAMQSKLLEEVREHIGLGPWPPPQSNRPRHNEAPPAEMSPTIRAELQEYFRPHNIELRDYLGRDLPWMQQA